jgi:hypothetical protein
MAMNTPSAATVWVAPVLTFFSRAPVTPRGSVRQHLVQHVLPDHLDLRMVEQALLQDLLGAELVLAVHDVTLEAKLVRNRASSTAVLPPPTTITCLPR